MLSATNPVTLGAWWLATELGKRGVRRLPILINRQAVATLHDLVTVIGVEVAGIYGTGFRQGDAGWIFGAELVELIHCFPMSGESLRNGLRHITAIPLRSEYDRIYLYRCLADHRSAGLQLADPAMLTREEREVIAKKLANVLYQPCPRCDELNLKKWRDGFEQRFDLRLTLKGIRKTQSDAEETDVQAALDALARFLESVGGVSVMSAIHAFNELRISTRIPQPLPLRSDQFSLSQCCRRSLRATGAGPECRSHKRLPS